MEFNIKTDSEEQRYFVPREKPKRVAIVALGISVIDYFQAAMKLGGNRFALADETWTINKAGGVIQSDIVFRMDDLRKSYEINHTEYMDFRGDRMMVEHVWNDFLKNDCQVPIMTSKAYPEFPTSVTFPLEDVINACQTSYFNTSPSYAIGYAIYLGVKEINLYGIDFSYPGGNRHAAEAGRACVESLLHIAMKIHGIQVNVAQNSTLLDTNVPNDRKLYGYAGIVEVRPHPDIANKVRVEYRDDLDHRRKAEKEEAERKTLNILLAKYKPHLLDAIPQGSSQVETLKGDSEQWQAQSDIPPESPM